MKENRKYFVLAGILFVVIVLAVMNWDSFLPPEQQRPSEPSPGVQVDQETADTGAIDKPGAEHERMGGEDVPEPAVLEKKEIKTIKKEMKSAYQRLLDDVGGFFGYLDQQNYIKEYGLEGGTRCHFLTLLAELSAYPPVISGETQDIYTLTHNMAHFYRVIRTENIFLVKDILSHESEIVEQVADLLYEWITEEMGRKNPEVKTSIKDLYEYAGFFLTTLSGRAYLARRPSKTRMIVLYYSILITDAANQADLNRYGIDILPPLNLLMNDMENQRNLDYQRKYLRRLGSIKQRVIGQREQGVIKYESGRGIPYAGGTTN